MKRCFKCFGLLFLLISVLVGVCYIKKIKNIKYANSEARMVKYLDSFQTYNRMSGNSECDSWYPDAKNKMFEIGRDSNSNELLFLVDGCAWGLNDILSNTTWETYFYNRKNSSDNTINNNYKNLDLNQFNEALSRFKINICEVEKDRISNGSIEEKKGFNNGYCVIGNYVDEVDISSTCSEWDNSVDVIEFTLNGELYKYGYNYSSTGANFVYYRNCENDSITSILNKASKAGKHDQVCEYFYDLYKDGYLDESDVNVLNGTYSGGENYTSCTKYDFNQVKNISNACTQIGDRYVTRNYFRVSQSLCDALNSLSLERTCDDYDTNVEVLEFTKDGIQYRYGYQFDGVNANYIDLRSTCGSEDLSGILHYAKEAGVKNTVCNYFNNLYEKGLIDESDYYILKGTYEEKTGLSPLYSDNCSNEMSTITNINKCTTKSSGHYVDQSNFRISDEVCNNIDDFIDDVEEIEKVNTSGSTIKNTNILSTSIAKSCNIDKDIDSQISNEVSIQSTYKINNGYGVGGVNENIKINPYCSLQCVEKINYSYPSVFETVKSGTYFELISPPNYSTSYLCQEEFSYNWWRNDYNKYLFEEKKAFINMQNKSAVDNLGFSYGTCGSDENKKVLTYFSSGSLSYYYLDSNGNVNIASINLRDYSQCSNDSTVNVTNSLKNSILIKLQILTNSGFDYRKSVGFYQSNYNTSKSNRELLEDYNIDCYEMLDKNKIDTDNFYKTVPVINFSYETGEKDIFGNEREYTEKLGTYVNEYYLNDTDSYSLNSNSKSSEKDIINISYGGYNDSFEAYTLQPDSNGVSYVMRSVVRNYEFPSHNKLYYSRYQTGEINTNRDGIKLGYVYPVKLTSSGKRNVKFSIDLNDSVLTNDMKNIFATNSNNEYKCSYNITNDVVVKDISQGEGKYKAKFYVRSISTEDVDPNDRFSNGLLGANWASTKGQDLMSLIEIKNKNNNTYNPNNLEYSFTLNAQTIEAIREYNNSVNNYDNFDKTTFSCNDMGGECRSKFLDELAGKNGSNISRVGGIVVKNVNAIMKRKSWKYYINGSWLMSDSLNGTNNWTILSNSNNIKKSSNEVLDGCRKDTVKKTYDCIYKYINEGVLP